MRVGSFAVQEKWHASNKQALSLFRLRLFKHALNQIPLAHAAIANTQAFPVEFLEDLNKNRQPAHNGVNSLGRDVQNRVDERAAMFNDVAQHAIHIVASNFFARSARHNPCVYFRKRANGATDTVEFLAEPVQAPVLSAAISLRTLARMAEISFSVGRMSPTKRLYEESDPCGKLVRATSMPFSITVISVEPPPISIRAPSSNVPRDDAPTNPKCASSAFESSEIEQPAPCSIAAIACALFEILRSTAVANTSMRSGDK